MPAPLASDYALPAYAQLSPQDEVSFAITGHPSAGVWLFTADGAFVYVITTVNTNITTSAAAGNRNFSVEHIDASGNVLSLWPGAAVLGPASAAIFTASVQISTPVAIGAAQIIPLGVIPLSAGMQLQVALGNVQAGDTVPAPFITALRYSTAPDESNRPAFLQPAPLIA